MATATRLRRRWFYSAAGMVPFLDLSVLMRSAELISLNMKITTLISALAMVAAGLGAGVAIASTGQDAAKVVDLFDDWRLVGFCLVGSVCGAFMAIAVFTPNIDGEPSDLIRRLLAKFGTSILSGFTFSPGILSYWRATFAPDGGLPSPSIVLSVSGLVATIFVWLIHKFGPIAVDYARARWGSKRRRR